MNKILKYSLSIMAVAITIVIVAILLGAPTQILTGMPHLGWDTTLQFSLVIVEKLEMGFFTCNC